MVTFPASLKAVGGARSGIAPVHLLDVQDVNGNNYFWSDRNGSYPNSLQVYNDVQVTVPGTAMPWVTASGQNSDYAFGIDDGTAPLIVPLALSGGELLYVSATGMVKAGSIWPMVGPNGGSTPVGNSKGTTGTYEPTYYLTGSTLGLNGLCGAFTDARGNVISPVSIGASATLTVPVGATQLQLGVVDDKFSDNTGSFSVSVSSAAQGSEMVQYSPWLLDVPEFAFHRSLQTDTGSFVLQNLSGDTLSRDAEKILRASALEGALFVYRLWQADAEAAWLEVHGTLTVDPAGTSDLTLKGSQLINPSQDDTPLENYSETCQLDWAGKRCGSRQATECSYSFQTCQVVERIMVVLNNYEKNFGESTANTAQKVINRRRGI